MRAEYKSAGMIKNVEKPGEASLVRAASEEAVTYMHYILASNNTMVSELWWLTAG